MSKKITFSIPFSKVDEEERMVYGIATAEVLDKQNEIVDYEASKKAFSEWSGNIREMHGDKAVGKKIDLQFDDANKAVILGAYVSKSRDGEDAWTKIKEGILTGYSIGGRVFETESETAKSADGKNISAMRIKNYELAETSFVDSPACPVAEFKLIKSVAGKKKELEQVEKMVEHPKPVPILGWQKTFIYSIDQYNALKKNQAEAVEVKEFSKQDSEATEPEKDAKVEPEEPAENEQPQDAPQSDAPDEGDASPQGTQDESGGESETVGQPEGETPREEVPVETAAASEEPAPSAADVSDETPAAQETDTDTDKADKPKQLRKDLYTVGSFADAIACIASIRDWCVMEQEWEGDDSAVPAKLTAAVETLGGILQEMAQEEASEAAGTDNSLILADQPDMKKIEATILQTTQTMLDKQAELLIGKVGDVIKPLADRVASLEDQPAASNRPVASYHEVEKGVASPTVPDPVGSAQGELVKRYKELEEYGRSRKNDQSFSITDRQRLVDEMWKLNKQINGVTTAQLDPTLPATFPHAFSK